MHSSLVSEMLRDISFDNPYMDDFKANNKLVLKKKKADINDYKPSELRISTITALSSIGTLVDTNKLYEKYDIDFYADKIKKYLDNELDESEYPLIITIQKSNNVFKGIDNGKRKKKEELTQTFKKKRDSFQNQLTFIVAISNTKNINLKLFKNGKIQMTGLRSEEDGYKAINNLISNIKHIDGISENNKIMKCADLNVILINSDFDLGFKIKRDELFKLMGEKGVYVVYEPDIYPGVNSKYYFNENNVNTTRQGICCCSKECNGKGCGNGDGECKKITIAIFQSGSIIITGSKTRNQMMLAYNFINDLISKNIDIVKKNDAYIPKCQIESGNKVYYIKKSNILNREAMDIPLL